MQNDQRWSLVKGQWEVEQPTGWRRNMWQQIRGYRRAVKRNPNHRGQRVFCQRLEPRFLLSTDTWLGATGDGVTWSQGLNWTEGHAPQAGEDVVINLPNSGVISFDSSAGNVNIHSLSGNDPLAISGGSLTVSGNPPSPSLPYSGAMTITGGALAASGSGTILNAGGNSAVSNAQLLEADHGGVLNFPAAIAITAVNLDAESGGTIAFAQATGLSGVDLAAVGTGQLLFPAATSYSNSSTGNGYSIQASGTGSRINLASLKSFAGSSGGYPYGTTNVTADTGGEVDLGGAVTGVTILTLSDAASTFNVAGVTSLQDTSVNVSGAGTMNFSTLTSLTRVNLAAGTTGASATAGQLLFPVATSYSNNSTGSGYSIQASGTGSRINLASLTSFAGSSGGYPYGTTNVTADTGGEVDLGGAVTGNNSMTVDATSALGVANITKFDGTSLIASRPLTFTSATEVVDSSLTAKGVTLSFPAATTLVRDNLTASTAGQFLFPAATSYSNNSTGNGYSIQASGTGSRINLASLTSFAGSSGRYPYGTTNVTADTGGQVDLAGQIGGGVTITSDGAASALNFHTTTSFTGNPTITSKNNGPIYNYGSFSTDNVTINLTGSTLTNQPGAVIYGSGTITGNLSNAGYVAPGASPFDAAGKLTVIGDYSQTSSGAFRAELGGTTFGTLYDCLLYTSDAADD